MKHYRMLRQGIGIGLLCMFWAPHAARGAAYDPPDHEAVKAAIVKIYTIFDSPNYYNPWSMNGPASATGSGCVISGKRILTNAHVVSDQTFIQVRRYGEAARFVARVLNVSHEADLALLTVDDPAFFEGIEPLALGDVPRVQQEVVVYGFPLGGDTLSLTQGVISRVEHAWYAHSGCEFLAVQIDAAVNPGNSGGPAVVGERIVGVVMQIMGAAENISYVVPVPIVEHFLKDIEDGRYDGFPSLGAALQGMESGALKRRYRLEADQTGMLVFKVLPGSPADGKLREDDVLLAIDGRAVADDGTIEFRSKERTHLSYLVQRRQVGESIGLEILRDGKRQKLTLDLRRALTQDWLVPMAHYDRPPSYFIYGGVVFTPLCVNLLQAWGEAWMQEAPRELAAKLSFNYVTDDVREVVLALRVLPAEVNEGYHDVTNWEVVKVNGQKIGALKDVVRLLEARAETPFAVIEGRQGDRIVLDRQEVERSAASILKTYRIQSDRSSDLQEPRP